MIEAMRSLRTRVMNSVARAVISALDDTGDYQVVKLDVLADETLEDVERVQNFGFASNPPSGAEAVLLLVGGNRDHPIVISADTPKTRKKSLQPGEAAVYGNATANYLYLKKDDTSELKTKKLTLMLTDGLTVDGGVLEIDITKIRIKNAAGDDLISLLVDLATGVTHATTTSPGNPIAAAEVALVIPKLTAFKV